jgi:hypothetical protein
MGLFTENRPSSSVVDAALSPTLTLSGFLLSVHLVWSWNMFIAVVIIGVCSVERYHCLDRHPRVIAL